MADKPATKSTDKPTHLAVRALRDGFRRAGRAWSKEETTVPLDELSAAQIVALDTEPLLVVKRVTIVEEKPAK